MTFVETEGAPLDPRRVKATTLDSRTGQKLGSGEWQTLFRELGVFPTRNGEFIVRTRQKMTLYSARIEALHEFPLPDSREKQWDEWKIYLSPTRASVGVGHYVDADLELTWLDSRTLQRLASWRAPQADSWKLEEHALRPINPLYEDLSISDDGLLATVQPLNSDECRVLFAHQTDSVHLVFSSPTHCGQGAQFLNADTLLIHQSSVHRGEWRGPHEILVVKSSGEVIYRERLASKEKEYALSARPSTDGRRFVIPIDSQKGGSRVLDINPREVLNRIAVFHIPSRDWVSAIDGKRSNLVNVSGFALSPDGLRLAVIRDGAIELYRLPGQP